MTEGFSSPVLGGGGSLVRPSAHSPGYAAGSTGWSINKDGSAEFNNLTLRGTFSGTGFIINAAGAFFYDGTPAANNLISSIASAPGTDAFGNTYQNGLCSYDTNGNTGAIGYVQILQGEMTIGAVTAGVFQSTADAASFNSNTSELNIFTSKDPGNLVNTASQIWAIYKSGKSGVGTGGAGVPVITIADAANASAVDSGISGTLYKTDLNRVAEIWHVVGAVGEQPYLSANFAAGSVASANYQQLEYRLDPLNNNVVEGTFHATAALAAGAYSVFSLPVGWRPKKIRPIVGLHVSNADVFKTAMRVNVDLSGTVNFSTPVAIAIGDGFYFQATVPLNNIT